MKQDISAQNNNNNNGAHSSEANNSTDQMKGKSDSLARRSRSVDAERLGTGSFPETHQAAIPLTGSADFFEKYKEVSELPSSSGSAQSAPPPTAKPTPPVASTKPYNVHHPNIMKGKMWTFSKIKSGITSLAERVTQVMAPMQPHVQLRDQWKKLETLFDDVQHYYEGVANGTSQDKLDEQLVLTKITDHLRELIKLLQMEDTNVPENETGPCMEIFLRERVMATLCQFALLDEPPGALPVILRGLSDLIGSINQPLLPHQTVSHAILYLLERSRSLPSFNSANYKTKEQYVELVYTLCCKVEQDPRQLDLFFFNHNPTPLSPRSPIRAAQLQQQQQQQQQQQKNDDAEFKLFSYLLPYVNDFGMEGKHARSGLLCCCRMQNDRITEYIVKQSNFTRFLIHGLISLYSSLPKVLDSIDSLPDSQDLVHFRERLDYFNELCEVASEDILVIFIKNMKEDFLESVLGPSLLRMEERDSIAATVYTNIMVRSLCLSCLGAPFVRLLVGPATNKPEVASSRNGDEEDDGSLRTLLIRRINDVSDNLSIVTLQLFDSLISCFPTETLNNLVLRNFDNGRDALMRLSGVEEKHIEFSSISVDEYFPKFFPKVDRDHPSFQFYLQDAYTVISKYLHIMDAQVIEEKLRRAKIGEEIHDLVAAVPTVNANQSAYVNATITKSSAKEEVLPDSEAVFYEGMFLEALFSKLETFLEQSLEMNLVLTGILSKMAQYPHPALQRYLLCPTHRQKLRPGVRSMPQIMQQLSAKVASRAEKMPDFEARLAAERRSMGIITSQQQQQHETPQQQQQQQQPSAQTPRKDATQTEQLFHNPAVIETVDDRHFLQAVVLLEEFRKELTAIIDAKAQYENLYNLQFAPHT